MPVHSPLAFSVSFFFFCFFFQIRYFSQSQVFSVELIVLVKNKAKFEAPGLARPRCYLPIIIGVPCTPYYQRDVGWLPRGKVEVGDDWLLEH